jgi:type I restriction enzyme S subunit
LGQVSKVKGGKRLPKGGALSSIPNKHPYIRVRDMGEKYLPIKDLEYVPDDIFPQIKNYIVSAGDVILSIVGSVGLISIVNQELNNASLTENCVKIIPEENQLDREFLYYFLNSKEGQDQIKQKTVGAVQPKLPIYNINDLEINLPPLPTQKAIAEILSCLDDKIELNNQINQNLEALAQALFKQWFVDFEFPNENGEPYKSSGGEMIDSELGEIPKGWEVYRLKELLTIKRGGSPRPIQDFMADSGLPWVKISDATAINNPFLFKTKEFIKLEGLRKTVLMKKGSLILSNSATPGLPIFLELDACIHDGWLHFQDIKLLSYNFLYLFFIEIRKDLVGKGNGSIFINLKTDILKEYQISVSTPEVLSRFSKVIDPIFENIKQVALENRNLIQLRDTLLPKLISGELEVNESLLEPTF